MNIIFIADAYYSDIPGGGEANNEELIYQLRKKHNSVYTYYSHEINYTHITSLISQPQKYGFIIANFVNFQELYNIFCKNKKLNYIIYEHDHKYVKSRNPSIYNNFQAPPDEIIHKQFYSESKAVMCQSQFQLDIIKKNLNIDNLINLSGNLWFEKNLEYIASLTNNTKRDMVSIMNSPIPHKGTQNAIKYCQIKNLDYELIDPCEWEEFIYGLSRNDKFMFYPQTPETLSRVVVEAKMLGCKIITNNLVGATKEPWFSLKSQELIDFMQNKKLEIVNTVLKALNDE